MPIETYVRDFVTVWVVVDPIGTVPVFIAVTAALSDGERRRVALRAALVSAAILLAFILVGQILLDALSISLVSFQIAGGIVLFLFALQMIFGPSKPESEVAEADKHHEDVAIFPLAVPSLASPGAMLAVVVLTDNNRYSITEQAVTTGLTFLVILAALLLMLGAGFINRLIGRSGASILSRVMGLILAAVAVDNVRQALLPSLPT
ncbi:MAG: MarC family protein [Kiloniellales bacterium]|nr:MarC family protein [Kiloniellales bacterium]MDJ0970281.1 MarC family protein [Kiloniellales bacterium]MDJ0980314.1 MarC family protein [Kiloniellales bacterium]